MEDLEALYVGSKVKISRQLLENDRSEQTGVVVSLLRNKTVIEEYNKRRHYDLVFVVEWREHQFVLTPDEVNFIN